MTSARLFAYNPETGDLLWAAGKLSGKPAGWKNYKKNGAPASIRVRITESGKTKNKTVSRIAWEIVHGAIPSGALVDHKNGNPFDNRIGNLRLCDKFQNAMNQRVPSHNVSGKRGVSYHPKTGKWQAEIYFRKSRQYLGLFENKNDAIAAREKAERELFGDFSPLVSRTGAAL